MRINDLIKKARRLGLVLGIKKLAGYEAVFTWGIRGRINGQELYKEKSSAAPFTIYPHSENYWYADPLLCEYDNRQVVFMECMDRKTGIGSIGYVDLKESYTPAPQVKIVIKENYHMSFPMTFLWGDELYLLPETEMNASLVLYRCTSFPEKWEKTAELLQGHRIVDSVLIKAQGSRASFLASEYDPEDPKSTRFCRFDLVKETTGISAVWHGTDQNDYTYNSRTAGGIIENRIIPLQRSTPGIYGYSIQFHTFKDSEILEMCREILPSDLPVAGRHKKLIGTHTYSQSSEFEVIDVEYLVFDRKKWIDRIKGSKK